MAHVENSGNWPQQTRECVEVLARLRFDERELLLPVGVAHLAEDSLGRRVLMIRLALLDQSVFLPFWDILVLAGLDPRDLPGLATAVP